MSEFAFLLFLYGLAIAVLVAEIFIPSHGVLTIAGVGILIGAIVRTFQDYGNATGAVAVIASLVALPVFAVMTVRIWPHTWIGRLVAPPNPVYTEGEFASEIEELKSLVGQRGTAVTPLRPVGTCEFNGRRLQCVCQGEMIQSGTVVQAVSLRGRSLEVAAADNQAAV